MRAEYYLFLDGRESPRLLNDLATALSQEARGSITATSPPRSQIQRLTSVHLDPDTIIRALHQLPWEHQPLLVYRMLNQDRWSHLRIAPALDTLWGDEGRDHAQGMGQDRESPVVEHEDRHRSGGAAGDSGPDSWLRGRSGSPGDGRLGARAGDVTEGSGC